MLPRTRALLLALLLFAVPAARATAAPVAAPSRGDIAQSAKDNSLRHYLQGLYLEGQGDLHGAMAEIGQAFLYDPAAPDLPLKLADLALLSGDGDLALDFARRSIALGDRTGRAHFLAGAALAGSGRPQDARHEFSLAAAMDSTDIATLLALARLDEDLGDLPAARASYARAFALDPEDDEIAYRLGMTEARLDHWGAADTLLSQVAESNPSLPALAVTRAFLAERQGRIAEAAKGYEAHLAQFPADRQTRRRLVQCYVRLAEWPAATREAKTVFEESPGDFDAGRVLASLYLTQKQDGAAAEVVRTLRKHLPGQIEPTAFAVAVLLNVGREEEARAQADQLTHERPGDARAWMIAAEAWAARDTEGKWSREADQRYARAEAVLPDSLGARTELARSYTRTARFDRAEALLEKALDADGKNSRLWLELAFARERRKDVPGAEQAARQSLDLEPRNGQALNFLGYLYADYKVKVDQAVPLIEQALALDPDNPYYIDSLGWAYYRLGRLEDARGQLEKAIALGGDEPRCSNTWGTCTSRWPGRMTRSRCTRRHYSSIPPSSPCPANSRPCADSKPPELPFPRGCNSMR
jgi:Flp pilus assembly protein TadD